ncbi:hypoxanthine phosphoribosyltransferase [Candidatus Epulonipiscium viviparus]|uniref:hypoxanthine phosphoribosyltransferase n=1 Tax=Candidatus Epulonipiscium viviparus TaxID=420336 RepID=UPI00016C0470|nr:hypoxanthine phosphoribosyltransferase [Candidatus Epulopiscium viviparus]
MSDILIEKLIGEEEITRRIREIGQQISDDYAGEEILLLCVLKGGVMFMTELAKNISIPLNMDFMSVSSYGNEVVSSGVIKILKDLDEPINDKHIIIVEDIIDSGCTLSYLRNILEARGPKSIKICTLLDKPQTRKVEVNVDYVGFNIPDEFVVGYGLDYQQKYRNLPYIAKVRREYI